MFCAQTVGKPVTAVTPAIAAPPFRTARRETDFFRSVSVFFIFILPLLPALPSSPEPSLPAPRPPVAAPLAPYAAIIVALSALVASLSSAHP